MLPPPNFSFSYGFLLYLKKLFQALECTMFNKSPDTSENEFKETVKKYASKTDDAFRSGANNMKDKVESYPATSILLAVGIGFALGFISGRR